MAWHTSDKNRGANVLILDSGRVVGSIIEVNNRWDVEILWNGPGGDIRGHFSSYAMALAFSEGVEKTFAAMAKTEVSQ